MKLMWIVIIFLVIGGFIISKTNELDLGEEDDRKTFLKTFGVWVKGLSSNVKDVAGYAIKEHDWLPKDNETDNQTEVREE